MKKRMHFIILTVSSVLLCSTSQAGFEGKPLSDNEIRQLIIKGSLSDFENGMCYQKIEVNKETPKPSAPDSGTTTNTIHRSFNSGTFWPSYGLDITNSTQERIPPEDIAPTLKCPCPCPYSTNDKNQECGQSSAYYQYPIQHRPKCYPEDIKDWEVNDFRSSHEIPYK